MSYQNDRIKGIPAPLPKDYDRQANFTNWEVQNPGEPPRGTDLDAEFNAVEQAVDETQARLRLIQRDDGALLNESVGVDQLKNEARIGVNAATSWDEFTSYAVNDSVIDPDGAWYVALEPHVSSDNFQDDLTAGKWRLLIDLTPYTTEAKNWATLPEDQPVPEGDGTEYSAEHHAAKALASEIAAQLAQQNAEDAETEAKSARNTAVSAASNAQDAELGAEAARDEARDFVTSTEYDFAGDYTAGLTLTAYNQIVRDTSGEFWRVSGSETLPYTLTGAGVPEGGSLVSVGDAALRQDLVQPVATFNRASDMVSAANLDVGRKVRTLGYYEPGDGGGNDYEIVAADTGTDDGGSFIDLSGSGLQARSLGAPQRSIPGVEFLSDFIPPYDGYSVQVDAYRASYPALNLLGGGVFVWSESTPKSEHNGGTVFSPTVPYDWSDDGESYLSGLGETDTGGSGCWIRTSFDVITPLIFGAKADGQIGSGRNDSSNDSPSLEKALNFIHINDTYKTLDLAGRVYGLSSSIVCQSTPGFFNGKRVTNGSVQAKSDFSGGPVLDFTNVGVGRRSTFDNLYIVGGLKDSVSEAKGGIVMRDVFGAVITDCEIRFIDGPLLQFGDPDDPGGPAASTTITGNRLFGGGNTGNTNSIGIDANKGDCEVLDNIIGPMAIAGIYTRVGAITIKGNHIWMGEDAVVPNIMSEKAYQTIIVGNYIDNGPVRLEMTGDAPNTLTINSNKFVAKQSSIDNWNADSPINRGYIEFAARDVSNAVLRNVSVQGNTFRNSFNPSTDVTTIQCRTPGNFSSELREVYVKDNSHDDFITVRTTHPRVVKDFTNSSTVNIDVNDPSHGVRRLPGPWSAKYATSVVYQASQGGQTVGRVSRSGDVFSVNLDVGGSGSIILTASSNENGL